MLPLGLYRLYQLMKMSGNIAHKALSKGAHKKYMKENFRNVRDWDNPAILKQAGKFSPEELSLLGSAKTAAQNAAGYGAGIGGGLGILDYATSEKVRSEFPTKEAYEEYLESLR